MASILTPHKEQIQNWIYEGRTIRELAKVFGVQRDTMRWFVKHHIDYPEELKQANIDKTHANNSEEYVAEAIRKANPNLKYVSGYTRKQDPVNVRCLACGETFSKTFAGIVSKGQTGCPICRAIENKRRAEERERKRTEELRKREEDRRTQRLSRKYEQTSFNICQTCGGITTKRKYCGDRCRNRANYKAGEIKRRAKIANAMVDADITLEGLYKRDKGVCHICKGRCDLEDFVVTDKTIVCGDWYPSIDHVKPLSKGGLHSWENVKLAHRICNSRKSDTYLP